MSTVQIEEDFDAWASFETGNTARHSHFINNKLRSHPEYLGWKLMSEEALKQAEAAQKKLEAQKKSSGLGSNNKLPPRKDRLASEFFAEYASRCGYNCKRRIVPNDEAVRVTGDIGQAINLHKDCYLAWIKD